MVMQQCILHVQAQHTCPAILLLLAEQAQGCHCTGITNLLSRKTSYLSASSLALKPCCSAAAANCVSSEGSVTRAPMLCMAFLISWSMLAGCFKLRACALCRSCAKATRLHDNVGGVHTAAKLVLF